MSRRYRNHSHNKNKSFLAKLFNKWTLLAMLFLVVILLALFAANITTKNINAEKAAAIEAKEKEKNDPRQLAFKNFEKSMKPRLDFSKLKKSEFPELKEDILTTLKKSSYSGAILAIKDNKLIVNSAVGFSDKQADKKLTKNDYFMLASIQKSFTAAATMRLVEDNLLTLYTPLSQFFPQIPNSEYITIRNLLDMTSGLFAADYDQTALEEEEVLNEILPTIYYQPLYNGWEYSDVNYKILAGIIRKVSGKSYQDYVTEQIIVPLRLEHTGFYDKLIKNNKQIASYRGSDEEPYESKVKITEERYAAELGTGNIYTTTTDLMTYFQGLIDGHILRKNNLDTLMTHDPMYFNYTYVSGVYNRDDHIFSHGVFMGFEPTAILSKDGSTGVIFLSNTYNREQLSEELVKQLYQKITIPEQETTPNEATQENAVQDETVDPNQQVNDAQVEQYDDADYQATGEEQVYY